MLVPLTVSMVFLTASLFTMALLWRREDPVGERVRALGQYQSREGGSGLGSTFADRILLPTLTGLAAWLSAVLPTRVLEKVRRKLVMSGSTTTFNAFLIQWALLTVIPPALCLIVFLSSGQGFGGLQLLVLICLALFGAALPYLLLNMRINKRQKVIWRSLPDAFDLVTTSVEAGLGLDAALGRVAEKVPGPFASELRVALREVVMGKPRRQALLDLTARTGVEDLTTFVNAVIQAEQMGVSIGQVLRVQSDGMRTRRKQRAEQAARRAAIWLIFPVIFCNVPALFIVGVGPAMLLFFEALKGV